MRYKPRDADVLAYQIPGRVLWNQIGERLAEHFGLKPEQVSVFEDLGHIEVNTETRFVALGFGDWLVATPRGLTMMKNVLFRELFAEVPAPADSTPDGWEGLRWR